MPISPRSCNNARHSCSCSFVYSVREISTGGTCIPSLRSRPETTPMFVSLRAERATHCYIVHYTRANTSTCHRRASLIGLEWRDGWYSREETSAGAHSVRDPDPASDPPVRLHLRRAREG